ncbi:3-oxoacyl-ACP reductase [Lapillicoccus jejuensis]|uniref:3-oxoacyl-[acyl-carrier protein] reductase n=1 Tax=Lapillicoccus jejuensis TaxID=402171 RepID=A0A542E559_9MICO|nr:3-oxoacyl-ACP reductase [Lapillicoccus jejuensis]TQJ10480.1 3-oxoacyl-[acyl-carrier protein] reductase [Lapillicoccus jejuensis]
MTDTYSQFVNSPLGKQVASRLGIPRPVRLRRYTPGGALLEGSVLLGGYGDAPLAKRVRAVLDAEGIATATEPPTDGRVAAVVADLSAMTGPADLEALRALVGPALKRLAPSGRVLVLGASPEQAGADPVLAAARRALEGVVRSIGKELRAGATANLVLVEDGGEEEIESTVRFFLSGRSAYVDGQVVTVGPAGAGRRTPQSWVAPLAGKVAVVTGAARGIGASIADTLTRDGATVVCLDVPAAGDALAVVANRNGGSALQLDVTSPDAGARIVEHARTRHGSLDVVVHNAGITRDKLLANTDAARWQQVLDVNLLSVLRMNEAILAPGALSDGGHVVVLSSMSGIAGNRGQSNYAASKAGLIGAVHALGRDEDLRARGITVNAVAPGFIETEMTGRIPLATREMGRRINSLAQGGLPVDVAETIAWFAQDASAGVTGQVVRVCGQSMLGA